MTHATLHDTLFELQLARFDTLDTLDSSTQEGSLLAALRAAGWRASGSLRQDRARQRPVTDLELGRAARDGDSIAVEALDQRYRRRLVGYARSAGCPNDADDFAQIAFLSLLTTAKLDAPSFDVRRYLFKTVRNQSMKHGLRRLRMHELADDDTLPDADARTQLDALLVHENLTRATALVDARCTLAEQTVLAMTHSEHSVAEIAEQLELTTGNVRVIRHRALAKLRAGFDEDP